MSIEENKALFISIHFLACTTGHSASCLYSSASLSLCSTCRLQYGQRIISNLSMYSWEFAKAWISSLDS